MGRSKEEVNNGFPTGESVKRDYQKEFEAGMFDGLPDKFNLLELGFVPPHKIQQEDTCWAYASAAAFGSHLLLKGIVSSGEEEGILSESHAIYSTLELNNQQGYENEFGMIPYTNATGDLSYVADRGATVNYWVSGRGGVIDAIDPDEGMPTIQPRLTKRTVNKPQTYYAKEVHYLMDPVFPADPYFLMYIKYNLQKYGGIVCGIYWDSKYMTKVSANNYAYFFPTQGASHNSNHAVVIIGWDDDYDRNKFGGSQKPKSNGAFLIRNSLDQESVEGGDYFWSSYEAACFGENPYFFVNVEKNQFYEKPYWIKSLNVYGYSHSYFDWHQAGNDCIEVENVFAKEEGDYVAGVGFYVAVPCKATLGLEDGSTTKDLGEMICLDPGYYTKDVMPSIKVNSSKFSLKLTTTPTGKYEPLAALESYKTTVKNKARYPHIPVLKPGQAFINGNDVTTYFTPSINIGGYPCINAIIENKSSETMELKTAYDGLVLPSTGTHGYLYPLPKQLGASKNITLLWNIEPFGHEKVIGFSIGTGVDKKVGFLNSGLSDRLYIRAVLDNSKHTMKKLFQTSLEGFVPETCSAEDVKRGYAKTTITGRFPIAGAQVVAKVKDDDAMETHGTTVADDGTWTITDFALCGEDAVIKKDTEVTIQIIYQSTDSTAVTLATQELKKTIPAPYTVSGTTIMVWTFFGLIAAFAVFGQDTSYILCTEGFVLTGPVGANANAVRVNGNKHYYEISKHGESIFPDVQSIEGFQIKVKIDGITPSRNNDSRGLLVGKLTEGGRIADCSLEGDISGTGSVAGLVGTVGDGAKIENCTVDVTALGLTEFAGVALKLNGNNVTVKNVNVKGTVAADRAAGIALSAENTSFVNVTTDLRLTAKDKAASLAVDAKNCSASGCYASGTIAVANDIGINSVCGGLFATAEGAVLNSCFGNLEKMSGHFLGGLVGIADGCSVQQSFAQANLSSAGGTAGGLIGKMTSSIMVNCGSMGYIKDATFGGGLVGDGKGILEKCYAVVCIDNTSSQNSQAAGLAGFEPEGTIRDCLVAAGFMGGAKTDRLAPIGCGENCYAYSAMASKGGSFVSRGEVLRNALDLQQRESWEKLGIDLSAIWDFSADLGLPVLRGMPQSLVLDYPLSYVRVDLPATGIPVFKEDEKMKFSGKCSKRTEKIKWRVAQNDDPATVSLGMGDYANEGDDKWNVTIAGFEAGSYVVDIICVIDGLQYMTTFQAKVEKG